MINNLNFFHFNNILTYYPEVFLFISTSIILFINIFLPNNKSTFTYFSSLLILFICFILSLINFNGFKIYSFNNMFILDPLSSLTKLILYVIISLVLIYSRLFLIKKNITLFNNEFYLLILFSVLGQMIMISGNNLLSIYLGLELMSLTLCVLIASQKNNIFSSEAAIKYFILGILSSGFMLYGISILYGITGTLELQSIFNVIKLNNINCSVLALSLLLIIVGLSFKLGISPFHMWVPDVYQGASIIITLLLSTTPKLSLFVIIYRLLIKCLLPLVINWQKILLILAIFSLIIGNVSAITQYNFKRMIAYSSIAHMGLMLFSIISIKTSHNNLIIFNSCDSGLFYIITYIFAILGAFGVIILLKNNTCNKTDELDIFIGLHQRNPWCALIMMIFMFSLAGFPPTIGFYAKFFIFEKIFETQKIWLLLLIIMCSLIGTFYYIRIIKLMYFKNAIEKTKLSINLNIKILLSINAFLLLIFGLYPNFLLNFSEKLFI
ncbi:NADH-quinone oxidoreductase subunit N [Candidatus Profftella armatura]|uniref:NADH-quinone oxidoreductase subunit N n=1 Tax=Candidatus Profftella armatura TaxID=669502 RepID=S5R3Q5_9PROT|nr:NADH-quinone oxidoreductase subunit N [Candidatus Profftella armatura]AGS06819.1 NADH dehydrogenase subunit N [Candidatus Profftella armatura]QLK13729.1 NADH-quinone oxidoreductase subunit N [Candidatus Profftella armatura]